jgi:glycosyltransferase involved in cell wall biosynthesis
MSISSTPPATPLISVALCTYNGERYLAQQLDSLLAQTYPNFEVIAVDDVSSDGTLDILGEYARRDARLRYQCNPVNLGFRKNFEVALRACRGELIATCDQDDIWLPDKLSVLAEAMHESGAVLAYSDSELIDEQGHTLGRRIPCHVQLAIAAYNDPVPYLFKTECLGHATLLRREVVERAGPIPEHFYHDWWLAFVAVSIGKIVYVDRCLVRYRRHGDSISYCADHAARERGFRLRELQDAEVRLAAFAAFPGREQAFFQKLLVLWRKRNNAILSPGLAWFALRHRRRLFPHEPPARQIRLALKYFWGLRFKRWLEPHRYADSASRPG